MHLAVLRSQDSLTIVLCVVEHCIGSVLKVALFRWLVGVEWTTCEKPGRQLMM